MARPSRLTNSFFNPLKLRPIQPIQPTFISHTKTYHSYDHPTAPPYPPTETSILTASLTHVPIHGFSETALTRGAQDAGYLPISTNLFPRGVFELVLFYLVQRRLALKGRTVPEALGVGGRVRNLVLERLRMNREEGVGVRWSEVRYVLQSNPIQSCYTL